MAAGNLLTYGAYLEERWFWTCSVGCSAAVVSIRLSLGSAQQQMRLHKLYPFMNLDRFYDGSVGRVSQCFGACWILSPPLQGRTWRTQCHACDNECLVDVWHGNHVNQTCRGNHNSWRDKDINREMDSHSSIIFVACFTTKFTFYTLYRCVNLQNRSRESKSTADDLASLDRESSSRGDWTVGGVSSPGDGWPGKAIELTSEAVTFSNLQCIDRSRRGTWPETYRSWTKLTISIN